MEEDGVHLYALAFPFSELSGISESSIGAINTETAELGWLLTLNLTFFHLLEDWEQGTPNFKCGVHNKGSLKYFLYLFKERLKGRLRDPKLIKQLENNLVESAFYYPGMEHTFSYLMDGKKSPLDATADMQRLGDRGDEEEDDYQPGLVDDQDRERFCFWYSLLDQPGYNMESEVHVLLEGIAEEEPEAQEVGESEAEMEEAQAGDDDEEDGGDGDDSGGKKGSKPWSSIDIPDMKNQTQEEKYSIYYTPIPKRGGEPDEYAGYIVFVLSRDKNWNPGAALQKLLDTSPSDRAKEYKHLYNVCKNVRHPIFDIDRSVFAQNTVPLKNLDPFLRRKFLDPFRGEGNLKAGTHAHCFEGRIDHDSHFCHPKNWASPAAAMTLMEQMGGDTSFLQIEDWVESDFRNHTCVMMKPNRATVYHWPSYYHNWAGRQYQGVYKCAWPHRLDIMMARREKEGLTDDQEEPIPGIGIRRPSALKSDIYKNVRLNGAPYHCEDILQHLYYQSKSTFKDLQKMRPFDRESNPEDWDNWKQEIRKFSSMNTVYFNEAMKPNRPLTGPMKAVVDFAYSDKCKGHISCSSPLQDPNMDPYANMILAQALLFRSCFGIEDPQIPMIASGALMAADFRDGKPLYKALLCGDPGSGKTHPFLTLTEKLCIVGTCFMEHGTSAQADTVGHSVDEITLADEGGILVNKDQQQTDRDKTKLDTGILRVTRAAIRKDETGESRLVKEEHISVHNRTFLFASNHYPWHLNPAIANRLQYHIKTASLLNTIELDQGDIKDMDATRYFHLRQLAVYWVYKGIATKAIPDFNCGIYNQVIGKMLTYMSERGDKNQNDTSANRVYRNIMMNVRHQTVLRAVNIALNLPGGPCFMKEDWKAFLVHRVSPLLYPTMQVFLWEVFSLRHMWVKSYQGEIIMAACKVAGARMDGATLQNFPTTEEMIKYDKSESINWKRDYYDLNGNLLSHDMTTSLLAQKKRKDKGGDPMSDLNADRIPDNNQGSEHPQAQQEGGSVNMTVLKDCNYIALDGEEDLFQKISEQLPSDHRYPKEYIKKTLYQMSKNCHFSPKDGILLPADSAALKNISNGSKLPRKEDSSEETMRAVIKKGNTWYIAPQAAPIFDYEILWNAFLYAVVSDYMPPKKFILPIPHHKYRHIMHTVTVDQELIDAMVHQLDSGVASSEKMAALNRAKNRRKAEIEKQKRNQEEQRALKRLRTEEQDDEDEDAWMRDLEDAPDGEEPKEKEEDDGSEEIDYYMPLPRRLGVSFRRQNYMSPLIFKTLTAINFDPSRTKEEKKVDVERLKKFRQYPFYHIEKQSLDEYCCDQRAIDIGWEGELFTPKKIMEDYFTYIRENPEIMEGTEPYNYGVDNIRELEMQERATDIAENAGLKNLSITASLKIDSRKRKRITSPIVSGTLSTIPPPSVQQPRRSNNSSSRFDALATPTPSNSFAIIDLGSSGFGN